MKKSAYLIEYATAQIGRPYWCGTFGQYATEWLYHYNKSRLPMYYTANDFMSQLGQKVHDCVGLVKGAMWCATPNSAPVYNPKEDLTIQAFYNKATKKGTITPTVNKSFKNGTLVMTSGFSHVGIYCNGYVIQAKGHAYGVTKDVYISTNWAYWCECYAFEYTETPTPTPATDLKVGDKIGITSDATIYGTNKRFANFVYNATLYVLEIQKKNRVVFSIYPNGPVTGATNKKYVYKK